METVTLQRAPDFQWTRTPPASWPGDARVLAEALAKDVAGEVGFGAADRALYATDASNYRQVPIGVVRPRDADDVEATLARCREIGAPVLGRGGGTSLAGQCCNVAVVLDFSRHMNRILEVDPERRLARVQPGIVLDELRRVTVRDHGLTFGPDPATHSHCTLGGMIGNNSCGVHSVMAGRTADNVHELEVLTYDGARLRLGRTGEHELARVLAAGGRKAEIYRALVGVRDRYADLIRERFPNIPRRVSGYNLDELLPEKGFQVARSLVGSEGTLALTLEATVELVPWPSHRVLLVAAFDTVYAAADAVPRLMEAKPIGLEGIDERLVGDERRKGMHPKALDLLPDGGGWLLIELGGESRQEAAEHAERAREALSGASGLREERLFEEEREQELIWQIRESGLGATARVPDQPDTWEGWEDSAVPPERMGDYLRDLRKLYDRFDYQGSFYGHFGDGCLHTRITFDLTSRPGVRHFRAFLQEAAELAVSYGGSLSGEHGDGQARAELLPVMYGEELCRAFGEVKALWDPEGRMNPGKVAEPYPITSNLRLGEDYDPWEPETRFRYPEDDYHFSRAALRCVGVGKCRRHEGGVMCPSYLVTREERHSTRGRARLLFEMLQGEEITDGWKSEAVRESLDLCLACKGCKSDCPVNVDMATYKAEFLHHHFRGRLRPMPAYTMGLIYWWSRLAARVPRLANAVAQNPITGGLMKSLGGIARERPMPAYAPQTFRAWFAEEREASGRARGIDPARRVLLWPDTFNNFFHPEVARAAVEVLEAAGFEVEIPPRILCCGRPLYDYGMLDLAERQLRQILGTLREEIRAGVPLVGLEPSCVATFRDELPNLMPHDDDARRLSRQTYTLAELLATKADGFEPPRLERQAIVHGHCHHRSVMQLDADEAMLDRLGLDYRVLDSGCCGMAGSFGYERGEKYEVSIAAGERVLLPAVRQADLRTLILADGFSCRSQIEQTTDRRALHLAQVLQMALHEGAGGPPGDLPERDYVASYGGGKAKGLVAGLALAGSLGAGALAALAWRRRRRTA
jgi:FAD/FMN-containing dehydrogenase/Fe-S oxidoreductase